MRPSTVDDEITHVIIGSFYEVYNKLGFGFLESVYVAAMDCELRSRRRRLEWEVQVRIQYKGQAVGRHRIDMLVDESVIVEAKASAELPRSATAQVYNYLRATNLQSGLLLHFGHEPRFYRCINPRAERPAVSVVLR